MPNRAQRLRRIPKIDTLLARAERLDVFADVPRTRLARFVRGVVDGFRRRVEAGDDADPGRFFAAGAFEETLVGSWRRATRRRHEGVVNATGILLHTGLGRAPLSHAAVDALRDAGRYAVVEVDPETGARDRRELRVAALAAELVGAEAACVVNNNAAACLLTLSALAAGREVIISRGELVEIGGGFRMPDVMAASGCVLREVGTTNRTHLRDYEVALCERTGAVLLVHTSNFRIVGFTHRPATEELVRIAHARGVPLLYDVGSGLPRRVPCPALYDEPRVDEAVAAGADLVLFSGDKLLGGPQAGVLVGRAGPVETVRRHPLFRAVRPDKLTLAALEETLRAWLDAGDGRTPGLPLYDRLLAEEADLLERARSLADTLGGRLPWRVEARRTEAFLGSGAAPARPLPSAAVALSCGEAEAETVARRLRAGRPRVFCRVERGCVVLDLRTVFRDQIEALVAALTALGEDGDGAAESGGSS